MKKEKADANEFVDKFADLRSRAEEALRGQPIDLNELCVARQVF